MGDVMITIRLNENVCTLEQECSLQEVLLREGYTNPCVAVAVNKQFVPRVRYVNIFLKDGDSVEIVSPMQGG
jgi:sulfur carrier protein